MTPMKTEALTIKSDVEALQSALSPTSCDIDRVGGRGLVLMESVRSQDVSRPRAGGCVCVL